MVDPYASIGRCSTNPVEARPVRIVERLCRNASTAFFILPSVSRKTSWIIYFLLWSGDKAAPDQATNGPIDPQKETATEWNLSLLTFRFFLYEGKIEYLLIIVPPCRRSKIRPTSRTM